MPIRSISASRTSQHIQRRVTLQFEFELPFPPWMAYTLCKNMQGDAKVLIEDKEVDPRIVTALPVPCILPGVRIEICIPSQIVLHELQESCDPSLTAAMLSGFLAEDAQDYRAREAYLAMVVAVAGLPAREQGANQNHWNWSDTLEVRELDGQIHFIGTATPQ